MSLCGQLVDWHGRGQRLSPSRYPPKGARRNLERVLEWIPRECHIHRSQDIWRCSACFMFHFRGLANVPQFKGRNDATSLGGGPASQRMTIGKSPQETGHM